MKKDITYYMSISFNYNLIAEFVLEDNNQSGYFFGLIEELPGCHAIGSSYVEMLKTMESVKKFYFESKLEKSEFIPEPGDISLRRPSPNEKVRVQIRGSVIKETDDK
ncbi:type II toxin-antitoxin system HicB family antitoxin [Paenibacillus silvisoli]|uniref:type II toxin-antitoxin system HicB family antitoxin n=1 Tax=Paenibacillus silvisoli TaxID=3110539 RepID=UPI002805A543|nr:type II toxin-antitoxin system HicB family antitoxin [Paenibacillus silvisoli]